MKKTRPYVWNITFNYGVETLVSNLCQFLCIEGSKAIVRMTKSKTGKTHYILAG